MPDRSPSLPARTWVLLALVAALVALLVGWLIAGQSGGPAVAQAAPVAAPVGGITVSGEGTVSAVPTESQWSFTASVQDPDGTRAFDQASRKATALTNALKHAGAAGKDVQTSSISLSPNYSSSPMGQPGHITSYTASFTVTVAAPIKSASAIVEAAVHSGANQIDGPSLSLKDSESFYQQALALAIDQAHARAAAAAKAAGVSLGAPTAIDTTQSGPVVFAQAASAGAKAPGVPISPGQQQVTADVTVTYAIG